MLKTTVGCFLFCASFAAAAPARPLVAVAPFSPGASADEHRWLSLGLAELLLARLSRSEAVTPLSIRQWGAVLRERDIALGPVDGDAAAVAVGRSLGAAYVITGTYQARWPDVSVHARLVRVSDGQVVKDVREKVHLEEALSLDEKMVRPLLEALKVVPPAPGLTTKNVYAWHHAAMCREMITWQSLGPRARPLLSKAAATQARKHCEEALKLDATNADALEGLGIAQALEGDSKAALATLEKAKQARGRPDLAEIAIFWVRFRTGEKDAAVAELQGALKKRPGFLHARGTLGQALNEMGRHDEATKAFEAYLLAAPDQPWALSQLGYALARKQDYAGAIKHSKLAVEKAPSDATFLVELASRHIDAGELDDAERVLRQAMEKDPRAAVAYLRLGYVFLLKDARPLARAILEKALVEADLEAEWRVRGYASFDLAKLEMRENKRQAAIDRLKQAVKEGFPDVNLLLADKDLAPLRGDAAFKALASDIQKTKANWAELGKD